MPELFRIESDRAFLSWSSVGTHRMAADSSTPPGRLIITPRRTGLVFGERTWRAGVPEGAASDPREKVGPHLFEEQNYSLYLNTRAGARVELRHRDPTIQAQLQSGGDESAKYGLVNFRSQVGLSEFSVLVDDRPEFDFVIEVFPSKLAYEQDYLQLVADVQDTLTGLVFEYLRSTFLVGEPVPVPEPNQVEWLVLLRHVADDLDNAIQHIAHRPRWGLRRRSVNVRAERMRRADTSVRRAVLQGKGAGRLRPLSNGLPVRERLSEMRARPTLDTPEHRWLATQVALIRRRLAQLEREERRIASEHQERFGAPAVRSEQIVKEIAALESRFARLERLEPLSAAEGTAPPGFASLQLMSASGYREAYRACLVLSMGLRLTGGPVRMSIKQLHELYEYWCYLAVLRILSEKTDQPIPARDLLQTTERGLHVRVKRGRSASVALTDGSRKLTLTYNPLWDAKEYLTAQRPDLMLTIEDRDWPRVRMILDAKYRLDESDAFRDRFGIAGPPNDAINVLHRYRDAIVERDSVRGDRELRRTVVEGAVLYPLHVEDESEFRESRFWQSLERIGIGALPFLPGERRFVDEWVTTTLQRGGWSLADRAVPHLASERSRDWRQAASEYVLVGVLRGPVAAEHLEWIRGENLYYLPKLATQRRQYATKWVALYSPLSLRRPGAVAHVAPVRSVEVVKRSAIPTPWTSVQDGSSLQVLYELGPVGELDRPIENLNGVAFAQHRWTSRLALERARELQELFLETEPEWRLWENLHAAGMQFELRPGRVTLNDPEDPQGRAWFVVDGARAQYRGAGGFIVGHDDRETVYRADLSDVVRLLSGNDNSEAQ